MYNILEQILPSEIALKVFAYSRHPVADVMAKRIEKHEAKLVQWKTYCEKHNRMDSLLNSQFALFFFAAKKVSKASRRQTGAEDAKEDFRKLKLNYY